MTEPPDAARVVHERLRVQVGRLHASDEEVRDGVPDGIHQLRVACRRVRGALTTFGPLLDLSVTEPLRSELRWLARTLGDGRDAEVVQARLRGLVDAERPVLVVGPVRRRLAVEYAERRRTAATHAAGELGSRRHARLLALLDGLVAEPPWTEVASGTADEVLPALVARDWRRLRRRVDLVLVLETGDVEARDEALHDVRKAAKRLRYACEALEPWRGAPAEELRRAAQEVTRVLGERQDTAVARRDLRRIAGRASAAGESSFTYGLLHAREEVRAAELEGDLVEVWKRARRERLQEWLR